jgi:glutathione S-transferase
MLILYYWPGASSVVPHIVLEEIGAPYERQLVNLAQGEHKGGAYLKINPHGRVPALAVDGMVLTENVAILTYLAKRFPETQLLPRDINRRSALHINDGVVRERRSSDLRAYYPA